jgi:hypothetical protein
MLNVKFALLAAVAVLVGHFITLHLYPPPQLILKGVAWCYLDTYKKLDDVPPLPHSLIDVYAGGVRVYEKCNGL